MLLSRVILLLAFLPAFVSRAAAEDRKIIRERRIDYVSFARVTPAQTRPAVIHTFN